MQLTTGSERGAGGGEGRGSHLVPAEKPRCGPGPLLTTCVSLDPSLHLICASLTRL